MTATTTDEVGGELLREVTALVSGQHPDAPAMPVSGDYPSPWAGTDLRRSRLGAGHDKVRLVATDLGHYGLQVIVTDPRGVEIARASLTNMPAGVIAAVASTYLN